MKVYRHCFRKYSSMFKDSVSGRYYWRALSDIDQKHLLLKTKLYNNRYISDYRRRLFGARSHDGIEEYCPTINSPEQSIYLLSEALAVGGIDFIFLENLAVHHDLFLPLEHCCPAENVGIIKNCRQQNCLHLYLKKEPIYFDSAITLIGQSNNNYAHFLTETMPKLSILNSIDGYHDWPILIDADLHKNMMEALELLNIPSRPIIPLKRWQSAFVRKLVVISAPGYERYVPELLKPVEPAQYQNSFSIEALELLRREMEEAFDYTKEKPRKRLYLSRNKNSSNLRQLTNDSNIVYMLKNQGFRLLQPEFMTFAEQVKECQSAEIIVAPVGAALANMIFAPKGCKVIILGPYYKKASYSFFTNLAATLGHELFIVMGSQVGAKMQPSQKNYSINETDLMDAIEAVLDN